MEAQTPHRIEPLPGEKTDAASVPELYHKIAPVAFV
jgi:hypothetical protein